MLKELTWTFFEKTGSIEAFLEYNRMKGALSGEEDADKREGSDH